MVKLSWMIWQWLGRLLKAVIACATIPLIIGLAGALIQQADAVPAGPRSVGQWFRIGCWIYLGIHLLFYQPKALFQFQHGLLSRMATWLFGGQVATVEPDTGKGKGKTKSRAAKSDSSGKPEGSTLVAVSPYLVPFYSVLVCGLAWLIRRWTQHWWVDAGAALLLGGSVMLHWVMTADDLREDRERFPLTTYVLTIGLIGVLTLGLISLVLPLVAPGVSPAELLTDAWARTRAIYASLVQTLFL